MKRQDFDKMRERGLLINERPMISDDANAHLKQEPIVWFVEFPNESWLREDRINYTLQPLKAARFMSEYETNLFIKHHRLEEFGAVATEHEFVGGKEN